MEIQPRPRKIYNYQELSKELRVLRIEYKKMDSLSSEAAKIALRIIELDSKLKELDASIGVRTGRGGNYNPSYKKNSIKHWFLYLLRLLKH